MSYFRSNLLQNSEKKYLKPNLQIQTTIFDYIFQMMVAHGKISKTSLSFRTLGSKFQEGVKPGINTQDLIEKGRFGRVNYCGL